MIRTFCILLISSLVLSAQENPAEDPAHQQLRDLRTEMIAAIESRDIDRMMTYVHPEIVTTWQDGETTRGVDELRWTLKNKSAEVNISSPSKKKNPVSEYLFQISCEGIPESKAIHGLLANGRSQEQINEEQVSNEALSPISLSTDP